jgi:uncharacterized protein
MRPVLLCAALTALSCPPGAARADAPGGFTDCAKAETADEKAICSNIELVQADARMVTMFKIATGFVGMGERGTIDDAQVAWLAQRRACKADVTCLREAYGTRVRQLQKVLDDVKARGPF